MSASGPRQLASSWTLRLHFTDDLSAETPSRSNSGLAARSLCGMSKVYDDARLRAYGFPPEVLAKPRLMCKQCKVLGEAEVQR